MGKIADATFKGKVGAYAFEVYTTDTKFKFCWGSLHLFKTCS